ncbi:Ppx/GppA family phosphatase OS=Streptomyces tendae OX=1932 GN=F3L20_02065 PE=3 SV=1 [Streptomyces tendae]
MHLLVVHAHPGARLLPAHSHKAELRLAQLLDDDGSIGPGGIDLGRLAVVHEGAPGRRGQGRGGVLP